MTQSHFHGATKSDESHSLFLVKSIKERYDLLSGVFQKITALVSFESTLFLRGMPALNFSVTIAPQVQQLMYAKGFGDQPPLHRSEVM